MAQDPKWRRLEPGQLKRVAVVAHCLDNQWQPRPMLAQMTRRGLSLDDVHEKRSGYVRAEYLRALLTAQQVVVNRAFFYNNRSVYRDYLGPGPARDAFVSLLRSEAIVPHLHTEESPLQPPRDMTLVREGFDAWVDACRKTKEFSVSRLSWNPQRNKTLTENLGLAFQEFVQAAATRAARGGAAEFARHLGFPEEQAGAFRKRLQQLRQWAIQKEQEAEDDPEKGPLTRDEVYQEFVTPEGDKTVSGRCDPGKPFSQEIKQLVDLQYNTGLPEFLDRLPLRPVDTLHRAALRENRPERPAPGAADPPAVENALRSKLAFDVLTDHLDPFSTASLLSLDLPSIVRIRDTDIWRAYAAKLGDLVAEPLLFESRAGAVLEAYQDLLQVLAQGLPPIPWKTVRQSHLEISGVTLKVTFSRRPSFQQIGEITGDPPPCQATVRMAMVNRLSRAKAVPDLAVDTLHANIDDPRAFLSQIRRTLHHDGYRELGTRPRRERQGGMEQDREQRA